MFLAHPVFILIMKPDLHGKVSVMYCVLRPSPSDRSRAMVAAYQYFLTPSAELRRPLSNGAGLGDSGRCKGKRSLTVTQANKLSLPERKSVSWIPLLLSHVRFNTYLCDCLFKRQREWTEMAHFLKLTSEQRKR